MEASNVSAVLFAKDLQWISEFYIQALGMSCTHSDDHHVILNCRGFNLIVHQIPSHMADAGSPDQPLLRRVEGALRLSFPVANIVETRRVARSLGGEVDDTPPSWAAPNANAFLCYDPEGNVFKISER